MAAYCQPRQVYEEGTNVRKKIAMTALLLLLITVTSGCGFKDIDKRFFIVSTGIDMTGNSKLPYRITVRLAVPSPKIEPGAAKVQTESIEAKTIAEGVRLLKSQVDKELDFGHCKIFLFGEGFSHENIQDALDWLARRRDVQMIADVAIARPTAEAVLSINPDSERYPGNNMLLTFGRDGTESSYIVNAYIFDLFRRIGEKGLDPYVPIIYTQNNTYVIKHIAIMDKHRIKMILNPEETQLFNQLSRNFSKSSFACVVKGQNYVIAVSSLRTTYRIITAPDKTSATLKMKIHIKGIFETAPKLSIEKDLSALETELESQISASAAALLTKIQKTETDPFGFGLRYRATHYNKDADWQDWQRIYPNLKFEVKTNLTIEGSGLIK
ncbi:Ger(x)C family spore germination protein [Paenibacillaceae bacterium]|nr:Ger(x)C family spore germination protein [Paenibacillaceae bacterium]